MIPPEHHGVSDHRPTKCLFNSLFGLRKKHQKSALLALCKGNPPMTCRFPSQRASNVKSVSMLWCHNELWARCKQYACVYQWEMKAEKPFMSLLGNLEQWSMLPSSHCWAALVPPHVIRDRFLSLAQTKLGLCSANHRAGYVSNLACDWLSIVWAFWDWADVDESNLEMSYCELI